MLQRAMTVVAGTAVFATTIGMAASADTVDKVISTVESAVDASTVDVSHVEATVDGVVDDGVGGTKPVVGGIGGGDGGVGPVRGKSAVVGYIAMESSDTLGLAPTWQVWGQLSDPTQWACSGSGTASSYTVTCLPTTALLPLTYKCDVLHADISTLSPNSSGRTSLDCDSDGTAEAATAVVSGLDGNSVWSVDGRDVTAFTCTVDHAHGDWRGGCGDPGAPTVTAG